VLPLFTVYHYGGLNSIGRIDLDHHRFLEFAREHGRLVHDSHLVPSTRNAMIYGLGSIPNHFYNDLYYVAKERARLDAVEHPSNAPAGLTPGARGSHG
jgi:hypothetical protein